MTSKRKKEMKRVVVLQWLLKTPELKKLRVTSYLPTLVYFFDRSFPGGRAEDMELCINHTLKNKPETYHVSFQK